MREGSCIHLAGGGGILPTLQTVGGWQGRGQALGNRVRAGEWFPYLPRLSVKVIATRPLIGEVKKGVVFMSRKGMTVFLILLLLLVQSISTAAEGPTWDETVNYTKAKFSEIRTKVDDEIASLVLPSGNLIGDPDPYELAKKTKNYLDTVDMLRKDVMAQRDKFNIPDSEANPYWVPLYQYGDMLLGYLLLLYDYDNLEITDRYLFGQLLFTKYMDFDYGIYSAPAF